MKAAGIGTYVCEAVVDLMTLETASVSSWQQHWIADTPSCMVHQLDNFGKMVEKFYC